MSRARRGFTLVEMLVVIAITILLMGLLLGPLSQSFRLTARGRTMIAAQDNVRAALAQITHDLQDAMVVYDGLPVYLYGYSNMQSLRGHPHPGNNSVPGVVSDPVTGIPIEFRDTMVDMVLPKSRYFCTRAEHYVPDNLVAPNEAIVECPIHGAGYPVESRPIQPLQPTGVRVRYFVGLRQGFNPNQPDPTLPGSSSPAPHYLNPLLFAMSGSEFNNPYVLYRAEFDPNPNTPAGQLTRNWLLPNGRVNPNFWYDNAARPNGQSFATNWKVQAVAVISPVNTDMVRWVQQGGAWMPQPMTRFGPTPIENETLTPNRDTVTSDGAGGFQAAPVAPMQYVAENGHWSGPVDDFTLPLQPTELMGPASLTGVPTAQPFVQGPRIQIYETQAAAVGPALNLVYDSALPVAAVPRRRLFTWDSTRGIVNFALRSETTLNVNATGGGDEVPFSVSLKKDTQSIKLPLATDPDLTRTQNVPAGFGSLGTDPLLGPSLRIVPGSEVIQVLDNSGQPVRTFERAGWLGTGRDQVVAQADLGPDQYAIDYSNGLIQFSDRDPSIGGMPVHIRYQMQTNKSTDVVRVSYATRELFTVSVGVLQFEPGTTESQEVQQTIRIRLRNLSH